MGGTPKFSARRGAVISAASELINRKGVKGATLAEVADAVGLKTTSVTYYFKRKEALAAACFDHTLDLYAAHLDEAERAPGAHARIRRLIDLNIARYAAVSRGDVPPAALLSDMRTLEEPERARLLDRFNDIFRRIRAWFGDYESQLDRRLMTARAHVLIETLFWMEAWLDRYDVADYPRVGERLANIFEHGLAMRGGGDAHDRIIVSIHDREVVGREAFLRAATRLINERGYRGASVNRIASALNVTKGSFYHHLDAKDELVFECFERTFETILKAQTLATREGGTQWRQLVNTIAALLDFQFSTRGPLIRTTALHALPARMRSRALGRSNQIARRFAGTLIDGIAEASIRATDPLIASQVIMAAVNAAYELRPWADSIGGERAVDLYLSTLTRGLFAEGAASEA